VPEATNGTHYIWLKDMETGDTWGGITEPTSDFNVHTRIKFNPSSGLYDDKITISGYGFNDTEEICDVVFGYDLGYVSWVNLTTTTLGPAHPETDDLGSWEATFKVPNLAHTEYQVRVRQRGDAPRLAAWKKFTIGPSITLDIEEGPMGTIVEVSGRGFTNGRVIDTGSVWLNDTGWSNKCFVTDDDTVDNGKFKVDFVIPWVDDEDEYVVWVTDGAGRDADADFEVTGLAEIEVDPEFGSQGSTIHGRDRGRSGVRLPGLDHKSRGLQLHADIR